MRTALFVLVALTPLFPTACASTSGTARTRAANDFACSEEQVDIKNIGGTSYRVSGCGHVATYDCTEASSHGFLFFRRHQYLCVPEGSLASLR